MSDVTIEELKIPKSLDDAQGTAFTELTEVANEIDAAAIGNYDLAYSPTEMLPSFQSSYEPTRTFVARVDGRIVGWALHELQSGDAVRSAWLHADVLPAFRRRGIGSALYDRVEAIAAADKRAVAHSQVFHPTSTGEHIDSPTGYGSVPLDGDATRFLLTRGYHLAQVDRMSRLALPTVPPVVDAAPGYELEAWVGRTPEHRLADLAVLQARMSTDAPLGETEYEPEEWDEDRVRDLDARREAEGRLYFTTAVRHRASDTLVGFTELTAPQERHRPAFNHNTLVLREHRGHRLGMLIKCANLRLLQETVPGHPALYTWNAEENRFMLDVNEALGFTPFGYEGVWKKSL